MYDLKYDKFNYCYEVVERSSFNHCGIGLDPNFLRSFTNAVL